MKKNYVWTYKAKVQGGRGYINGQVEAPTFSQAEQIVFDDNLLVDSVELKLCRNVKPTQEFAA
ncbi:hypothetical protein [Acinetobacter towneri]|uniref:hypothetical protein n=1 Tax=Acinetobacter towneri TaxID=202956 RepID=UPI0034D5EC88